MMFCVMLISALIDVVRDADPEFALQNSVEDNCCWRRGDGTPSIGYRCVHQYTRACMPDNAPQTVLPGFVSACEETKAEWSFWHARFAAHQLVARVGAPVG